MTDDEVKRRLQERNDAIVIMPTVTGEFAAYVVDATSVKLKLARVYGRAEEPCPVTAARLAMEQADA